MYQVHLWPAEEQVSYPGHPPAAAPEGSGPDSGPEGGLYPQRALSEALLNQFEYLFTFLMTV